MSRDTSGNFVFYGGLMLFGLLCVPNAGVTTVIPVAIALYFMLVATNSISRGHNRAKRLSSKKAHR